MKFIRLIVVGLALLAAFACLSIFSTVTYTEKNTDLNGKEDKLPGVNVILSSLSSLLQLADKIKAPEFLPVAKTEVDYNKEMAQDIYDNADRIVKNAPEIRQENFQELANITPETIKNTNWRDFFKKINEALSKDWSRP